MLGKRGDLGVPYIRDISVVGFSRCQIAGLLVGARCIGSPWDGTSGPGYDRWIRVPYEGASELLCDGWCIGLDRNGPGLVHYLGLQLCDALADDGVDSPDQGRHFL